MARPGLIGWLLQRVTAVALVFFLGAHLWYAHYVAEWPLTWEDFTGSLFLRVVDIGILVLVVYHALYGVRTALLDFGVSPRAEKVITPLLWLIGIVTLAFGVQIFLFLLG